MSGMSGMSGMSICDKWAAFGVPWRPGSPHPRRS